MEPSVLSNEHAGQLCVPKKLRPFCQKKVCLYCGTRAKLFPKSFKCLQLFPTYFIYIYIERDRWRQQGAGCHCSNISAVLCSYTREHGEGPSPHPLSQTFSGRGAVLEQHLKGRFWRWADVLILFLKILN